MSNQPHKALNPVSSPCQPIASFPIASTRRSQQRKGTGRKRSSHTSPPCVTSSRRAHPRPAAPPERVRAASAWGAQGRRPEPAAAPAAGGTAGWPSAARMSGRRRRLSAAPEPHPRRTRTPSSLRYPRAPALLSPPTANAGRRGRARGPSGRRITAALIKSGASSPARRRGSGRTGGGARAVLGTEGGGEKHGAAGDRVTSYAT